MENFIFCAAATRLVFKVPSNIYDFFCENSYLLLAINYFRKEAQSETFESKKAAQKTDIPIKIVTEILDIISHFLYHNFDNSLSCPTFPTGMKYAEVTPIHKK